ncbi:hypothetical protein H4Q26_012440 [Puccinia striiformis f. sp. tritici PST-130]|nr:hypothetical protein H4Q26_012440 [Puccinia striiformis f. sp. tritici PST-130]
MQLVLILCALLVLLQIGATPNPSKRSIAPRTSSGAASRDPKAASAGAASRDPKAASAGAAHDSSANADPKPDDPCKGNPNSIGFLPLHPPAGSRHLI